MNKRKNDTMFEDGELPARFPWKQASRVLAFLLSSEIGCILCACVVGWLDTVPYCSGEVCIKHTPGTYAAPFQVGFVHGLLFFNLVWWGIVLWHYAFTD